MGILVVFVSGLAPLVGYAVFDSASSSTLAYVLAFAGGAISTMLANTVMPEVCERGGELVGIVTTSGPGWRPARWSGGRRQDTETLMGKVAIHTRAPTKTTQPTASITWRGPDPVTLLLIPAKNSETAKSTTPST